jgi:sec-independent protein translocase protein TatA
MTAPLAFLQNFGMQEMLVLGFLALLLFGARKLPELGRSLGKGIVEFKKGLKGLEDDVEGGGGKTADQAETPRPPQRIGGATPKFDDRQTDKEGQPRST